MRQYPFAGEFWELRHANHFGYRVYSSALSKPYQNCVAPAILYYLLIYIVVEHNKAFCTQINTTMTTNLLRFVLEFTALLVQPQHWKDSQPPRKREGWGGWNMGGLMRPSLCINRGPTAHLDYYHYHQLIVFNAAHQITTLLTVISTFCN